MAFKFIAAFALVAIASAGYVPAPQIYHAAPAAAVVKTITAPVAHYAAAPVAHYAAAPVAHYAAQPVLTKVNEEFDPHPQYKYAYDVQDSLSGDTKSHVEERDGDVVRGEYSLIDADGYKRTVQYTADDINGFNAVVHREPLVKHIAVAAPAVVKTQYAAPTAYKTIAPAYTTYSAPAGYAHH